MLLFLGTVVVLIIVALIYVQQEKFGELPSGKRKEIILKSPNYKKGGFRNLELTPTMTGVENFFKVLFELVFAKNRKPKNVLPTCKSNLKAILNNENVLVWFGHASYFIQLDGTKYLIDPVLSGVASPVRFSTKSFASTDVYTPEDLPEIDYLILTHDHWDHMDYETIIKLKNKVKKYICGLGIGSHLHRWGISDNKILEFDWFDSAQLSDKVKIKIYPTRHYSGRSFIRNKALWISILLESKTQTIYIGGDSGFGKHFEIIAEENPKIDLAILENGQYNKSWANIHMMPHQTLQAANILNAKRLMPIHSSKFILSTHAWNEPLAIISKLNEMGEKYLVTPVIGEIIDLNDTARSFSKWWENVE